MITKHETYEVVVAGGGLAGFCAAIAAARHGAKTCLLQDRPVLGGNASSEVRVTIHGCGAGHSHAREGGIIAEAVNAQSRLNHVQHIENGSANSVQDMVLYDMAVREPNLTLHLNTTLKDVQLDDGGWGLDLLGSWPSANEDRGYRHRPACHEGKRIAAVRAVVSNAETELLISGKQFIDCTGDGTMAHLGGCEWRWGCESNEQTGEIHAPARASTDTMGNSIHFMTIDIGRPAPYRAPDWAVRYEDDSFFKPSGRPISSHEGGFWWIEIGIPWDTLHDNESIRHELTRHALGIWDYMKNREPVMSKLCANRVLDFIGQVPGKRESRRIMGRHLLTENEIQSRTIFDDEVAYGGWFVDLHTPGGLLAKTSEPVAALGRDPRLKEVAYKYVGPYGIPLRCLQSKDVPNLQMAGRNVSVTHAALGTVRVMATCGTMGHAAGLAAGHAVTADIERDSVEVNGIQQALLRDGCFLPSVANADSADLARQATATASSQMRCGGLGAWQIDQDKGLRDYMREQGRNNSLSTDRDLCQWCYLAEGLLNRLGVQLRNTGSSEAEVTVTLRPVSSLWDYEKDSAEPLWQAVLPVPPGHDDLMWCDTKVQVLRDGAYRIEVAGPNEIEWRMSGDHGWGLAAGFIVGSGRYTWRKYAEFAFQLDPPQPCYGPSQVLTGVTRPQRSSNAWFSDPGLALPQQLELAWENPQVLRTVELTFPGQVVLEPRFEDPFYTAPHIAKRYRLQVCKGGNWRTVQTETDNCEVHRRHHFDHGVKADALRVVIEETHGGPSAGLVEVRCY